MSDGMLAGSIGADHLLARLPQELAESLTPEQRAAIRRAADERTWDFHHPVNLRVSLPSPFGRFFIAMAAGPERRNQFRLDTEHLANPLTTRGNLVLLSAAAAMLIVAGLAGALLFVALHSA